VGHISGPPRRGSWWRARGHGTLQDVTRLHAAINYLTKV